MQPLPRTVADKITAAEQLKQEGNEHFKSKEFKKAIGCYQRVGLFITGPPFSGNDGGGMGALSSGSVSEEKLTAEQEELVAALTKTMNLNLAACYIKEEKWEKASMRATKVLEKDPQNAKALFRRGHARILLNDFDRAQEDLEMAQSQSPDDKNIRQKLALLAKRRKQHLQKEKRTYANMFASSSTEDSSAAPPVSVADGQEAGVSQSPNTGPAVVDAVAGVASQPARQEGEKYQW